jgi:hypothetical protein
MVEGEDIPSEPPVGAKRRRDALERAASVGPSGQMEERSKGAVDQGCLLLELEIADVAMAKIKVHTRLVGTHLRLVEHRMRQVDADDRPTSRRRNRDGHPAVTDGELNERPNGLAGELRVEAHVFRHACRPLVVVTGEGLAPAHEQDPRLLIGSGEFG